MRIWDERGVVSNPANSRTFKSFLQEFSIPLIGGVVAAMTAANISSEGYHHFLGEPIPFLGISLHFLINDIFMVLFFGIAAKEITESWFSANPAAPPDWRRVHRC